LNQIKRVNGELNGVVIDDQNLNCSVVTKDGKTNTAINRIPDYLGWNMQVCFLSNNYNSFGTFFV
jgi:hypothetical protein